MSKKTNLSIDEKNRVPERSMFCFFGTYFGYPICCQFAFMSRMFNQVSDENAFMTYEGIQFSGSGYVPCRQCYSKTSEQQTQAINRYRMHEQPYHEIASRKHESDYEVIDRLLVSGEIYKTYLRMVQDFCKEDWNGLWQYTEHELKALKAMFSDIAELEKDDRPKRQHAELSKRCVLLGQLRYELVNKLKERGG